MPRYKPKTNKKWNATKTIRFLELYEERECLWNSLNIYYKNKDARMEAMKELVKFMKSLIPDFDVAQAKSKIRSLRNAYTLELHKIKKSLRSDSPDDIYEPSLPWFSVADKFLRNAIETRDVDEEIVIPACPNPDVELLKGNGFSHQRKRINKTRQGPLEDQLCASEVFYLSSEPDVPGPNSPPIKCEKEDSESRIEVELNPEDIFQNEPSESSMSGDSICDERDSIYDEHEAFGKTIAMHLRQLPANLALQCQSEILTYIINKRLGANEHSNQIFHNHQIDFTTYDKNSES